MAKLKLLVNGELQEVEAPETTLLLDALREGLGMTGTKRGCETSHCGACTVMVDGQAVRGTDPTRIGALLFSTGAIRHAAESGVDSTSSLVCAMKPIAISSQLCSPHCTSFFGSGFAGLLGELSHHAVAFTLVPGASFSGVSSL